MRRSTPAPTTATPWLMPIAALVPLAFGQLIALFKIYLIMCGKRYGEEPLYYDFPEMRECADLILAADVLILVYLSLPLLGHRLGMMLSRGQMTAVLAALVLASAMTWSAWILVKAAPRPEEVHHSGIEHFAGTWRGVSIEGLTYTLTLDTDGNAAHGRLVTRYDGAEEPWFEDVRGRLSARGLLHLRTRQENRLRLWSGDDTGTLETDSRGRPGFGALMFKLPAESTAPGRLGAVVAWNGMSGEARLTPFGEEVLFKGATIGIAREGRPVRRAKVLSVQEGRARLWFNLRASPPSMWTHLPGGPWTPEPGDVLFP